jgi:hypothetical protein
LSSKKLNFKAVSKHVSRIIQHHKVVAVETYSGQFHSKFFMEIFIIGAWLIWKQINDFIFNRAKPSFQGWKVGFIKVAHLQVVRMNENKKLAFQGLVQLYS